MTCGVCQHVYIGDPQPDLVPREMVCRRYPPAVRMVSQHGQMMTMGQFPPVNGAMICGEFKVRDGETQ